MTDSSPRPILVVDDDPDMRRILSGLLGKRYPVIEAADGREALEAIRRARPGLVILDAVMPGMSGVETLEAARGMSSLPAVIMLTGENDVGLAKRALELGAVEYITKPFSADYLLAEVERLLEPTSQDCEPRPYRPWRLGYR